MAWSISNAMMKDYENSNCSQVLGGGFLPASCWDTGQCALSNTTPMPDQYYWPDKTTEHSRLSRFGMTCELLMGSRGEELLTWFLAAFPARTSVSEAQATDSTASAAGYGQKCSVLLARFDRASCELKTVQCSLIEDLTGCSLTLPKWGSMRNGDVFLRPKPAHPICANESGSWPTPVASMSKGSSKASLTRKSGRDRSGDRLDHAIMASEGGHLNAEWVEWMMGWPIGQTDLKPLATAKFQEWQQQHGGF